MLNEKLFQINKIKKKFKGGCLLIVCNAVDKSSSGLPSFKKKFKNAHFTVLRLNNRVFKVALEFSIIKNLVTFLIQNLTMLVVLSNKNLLVKSKFFQFSNFLFPILGYSFNNKFYSKNVAKNFYSFNYFQNKQVLLQTCVLNLKKIQLQNSK